MFSQLFSFEKVNALEKRYDQTKLLSPFTAIPGWLFEVTVRSGQGSGLDRQIQV